MKLLHVAFSFIMAFTISSVQAVALAKKPTDDTVCDLSTMTTYRLSQRTFVEARTRDENAIYARLALRFVTKECKNGQLLLLHSEDGIAFDEQYFRVVTAQLCSVSNVTRESASTQEYPHAFVMRCPISKLKEATAALAEMEKAKLTEAMISEGAPIRSAQPNHPDEEPKNCGNAITWEMVALGWGGNCR
ncbi:hypothetical protein [Janthinobacterium sp. NKUCC06_STL]|uniref:hypothetical protein n=1 Tax=Janthinobacterium sp. NKUCC06_STL TaxID=2842127 RepID=UPI001C5AB0AA|nr:hypothetical protein [Janthinobacterium sp. NKUCC06_STL]MBW3512094.1 hypothetical protein [Janthinobacterium sp. NKUCC06_STL]